MSSKSDRLAFLCLGTMGYPMAGHLARAGHRVRVYNRTPATTARWLEEFAAHAPESAETPAEAVRGADAVFVCAGNDDDLREVILAPDAALSSMQPGACLVDHTTASPALAREIFARAKEIGVDFLDAPISGGQAGAQSGALTIMVGGEDEVYRRAIPWLGCYGKMHLLMGPSGAGQLTKAVNQICIAGLIQGLSEGLNFARRAGLDAERVVEVISKGAAQSWQMENRFKTMLDGKYDFGFAVDWMLKDLAIAFAVAEEIQAPLPITEAVDELYAEVKARGGGRLDTSSLMTLLD
ncbi:MAG: NAD(P)-dependent oxidoreductase [Myxococcales bacterium]|nr:NAD(P)-dependent oxidoreductase [Myxococcales bacterium]MCH7867221.1 NAD(P)-dependent oxidoreductase [Myxococcales bacterium]